ncbi:hypothetical protein PG994_011678 [Apiospora phragmitis]|uniref:NmrA-like domain-containing protein n=1 Tax=Apiospora phragmitis TaxID=2905665 RepID=A0ABR1TTJ0_9PEZI
MSHTILVTGATGRQGGAVVDALLALKQSDITILAVTRDTKGASAKTLADKSSSIKLVQGNLDNVPALFQEAKRVHSEPIWGVYSVQVSLDQGATLESEVAQGKAVIDEAIRNGVKHFVYSSVERGGDAASWENPTPILHFQSKYRIERYLRDVTSPGKQGEKMGWTILRPVAFMDNLKPEFPTKVFMAALRNHLKTDKSNQWVAVHDIGVFAAKAFSGPDTWNQRAVGLAGDELTVEEMDNSFLNATGHTTPVTFWFMGSVLTYMVSELRLMIGWFATDGYKADIKERRKEHPDLMTMEQWLSTTSAFRSK